MPSGTFNIFRDLILGVTMHLLAQNCIPGVGCTPMPIKIYIHSILGGRDCYARVCGSVKPTIDNQTSYTQRNKTIT